MNTPIRLLGCLVLFGGTLALFLEQNNMLMKLRMELPRLEQEVATKRDRQRTLLYEVERRESPHELLRVSQQPEFAHLEYPTRDAIIEIGEEH